MDYRSVEQIVTLGNSSTSLFQPNGISSVAINGTAADTTMLTLGDAAVITLDLGAVFPHGATVLSSRLRVTPVAGVGATFFGLSADLQCGSSADKAETAATTAWDPCFLGLGSDESPDLTELLSPLISAAAGMSASGDGCALLLLLHATSGSTFAQDLYYSTV